MKVLLQPYYDALQAAHGEAFFRLAETVAGNMGKIEDPVCGMLSDLISEITEAYWDEADCFECNGSGEVEEFCSECGGDCYDEEGFTCEGCGGDGVEDETCPQCSGEGIDDSAVDYVSMRREILGLEQWEWEGDEQGFRDCESGSEVADETAASSVPGEGDEDG